MTTATATAPAFTLAPVGEPHTTHEWDGVTSRTVTRQTYDVVADTPVLARVVGRLVRLDQVRVNVDDPADIDLVLLHQKARGGDYARRVGSIESVKSIRNHDVFAALRPILAAVEALLNPEPVEVHPADLTPGDMIGTTGGPWTIVTPAYVRMGDMAGGPVAYSVYARPRGTFGRATEFVFWPGHNVRVLGRDLTHPDPAAIAKGAK